MLRGCGEAPQAGSSTAALGWTRGSALGRVTDEIYVVTLRCTRQAPHQRTQGGPPSVTVGLHKPCPAVPRQVRLRSGWRPLVALCTARVGPRTHIPSQ